METLYNPFSQFIETKFSPYAGLWRMNFLQKCVATFDLLNGNLLCLVLCDIASSNPFIPAVFDFRGKGQPFVSFGLLDYVTLPLAFMFKLAGKVDSNNRNIEKRLSNLVGEWFAGILTVFTVLLLFLLVLVTLTARSLMTVALVLLISPIIGLVHIASQVMDGKKLKERVSPLLGSDIDVSTIQFKCFKESNLQKGEVAGFIFVTLENKEIKLDLEKALQEPVALNALLKLNPNGFTEKLLNLPNSSEEKECLCEVMRKVYPNSESMDFEALCFRALEAGHEIFGTILKESHVSNETRIKLFLLYFFGNEYIAPDEAQAVLWASMVSSNVRPDLFSRSSSLLVCNKILLRLYKPNVTDDLEQVNKLEDLINRLNDNLNSSNYPETQLKLYHIRLKAALLAQDSREVIELCLLPSFDEVSRDLTDQDYFELGSLLLANQADQSLIGKIFYQGWHLKKDEDCFSMLLRQHKNNYFELGQALLANKAEQSFILEAFYRGWHLTKDEKCFSELVRLLHQHDSEKMHQSKNLTQLSEDDIHQLIEKYITFPKNTPQATTSKPSSSNFSPVLSQKLPMDKNEDDNYPGMMEQRLVAAI